MKKTKIVCTLGPASAKKDVLKRMKQAGMNVARLNLSHGSQSLHTSYIRLLRTMDPGIPIIADLKGAEIRVQGLRKPLSITKGYTLTLSGSSDNAAIRVSYKHFHKAAKKNNTILLDDGHLKLHVRNVSNRIVYCTALNNGILKNNKKVTVPRADIKIPFPSAADKKDITFALSHRLEFIALSFVKTKADIEKVRKLIKQTNTKLIAKIETAEAVDNFDEILTASDGVMIARGDLGVELPLEQVPYIQKQLIKKCNVVGKPVITATQMLESMITNPLPTRAETTDVANAILDGTDAIMLSGESAVGMHPIDAVCMMTRIAHTIEKLVHHNVEGFTENVSENISRAVYNLTKGSMINKVIVPTASGFTACIIARFRPKKDIVAVTHDRMVRNQLQLVWGVTPLVFSQPLKHTHRTAMAAVRECYRHHLIAKSDRVVITGGIAAGVPGLTNLIEIHDVEQLLQ